MKNAIMTQPPMDKQVLKAALLQSLDDEIEAALLAAREAQATASHEGNKPENKWDTLALEAAYLAHGQSERILQLQQTRIMLAKWSVPDFPADEPIRSGACIHLLCDDVSQWLFIAPAGGRQLTLNGTAVLVVNHETPLAKTLNGLAAGDEALLTLGGRPALWEIDRVC